MKKTFRFLILGILVTGVGLFAAYYFLYDDYPYFKTLRKVRVTQFTAQNIRVTADVVCFNPNKVGAVVTDSDFDVYANGKLVSHIKQGGGAKIGADSEFSIPLVVNFSPKTIFKPMDLIGVAFISLRKKTISLRYDGVVKVALAANEVSIEVDYEDEYPLKE
jgi:LEA14-like dessication related protein